MPGTLVLSWTWAWPESEAEEAYERPSGVRTVTLERRPLTGSLNRSSTTPGAEARRSFGAGLALPRGACALASTGSPASKMPAAQPAIMPRADPSLRRRNLLFGNRLARLRALLEVA